MPRFGCLLDVTLPKVLQWVLGYRIPLQSDDALASLDDHIDDVREPSPKFNKTVRFWPDIPLIFNAGCLVICWISTVAGTGYQALEISRISYPAKKVFGQTLKK